jgi:hypothetical protein
MYLVTRVSSESVNLQFIFSFALPRDFLERVHKRHGLDMFSSHPKKILEMQFHGDAFNFIFDGQGTIVAARSKDDDILILADGRGKRACDIVSTNQSCCSFESNIRVFRHSSILSCPVGLGEQNNRLHCQCDGA